jgi:hypothetical protein
MLVLLNYSVLDFKLHRISLLSSERARIHACIEQF